jgi:hypothetical protein
MRVTRTRMASIGALMALGAIGLLLLAVGTAPAANRDAAVTFDDFPGPDEVTFGKNVSYRASIFNDPATGNSTYTQIQFKMTIPVTTVNGSEKKATLVYSSCESGPPYAGLSATEYTCPKLGQLKPGAAKLQVTLVWQTPGPQSDPPVTPSACSVTDCVLKTTGTWTLKESNATTPSPDTFAIPEETTLLVQPNPQKAGGYALNAVSAANCTTESANVSTNLGVGQANKIATAVCVGATPPNDPINPGLAIEIDESTPVYGEGFTAMSSICIPKPDLSCPLVSDAGAFPFPADKLATLIFKVPEVDFPSGEKLDLAFHNGVLYTDFPCTFDRDGKTKIWTVTCPANKNGDWRFG